MTGLVLLGGAVPASAQTLAWSVVSCVSPDTCTAAGEACHSNTQTTSLIESWDGNSWSVVPTPNPGIIDHVLNGVSCASQNFCMAAGWFFSNPTYRTLTLVGTAAG